MRPIASRHLWLPSGAPGGRRYLALYNGALASGTGYQIGAAESFDGTTWIKRSTVTPVIALGPATWDSDYVKDPCLLKFGPGDYRCWYAGSSTALSGASFQIGYATSSDGLTWTKYPGNPIITPGTTGAWDAYNVEFPSVYYEPSDVSKPFKMWYMGRSAGQLAEIGYAYSTDGINWTKSSANPVLTVGSTYDAGALYPGCMTKSGSTYYLIYGGVVTEASAPNETTVCLATFTAPEGTYTKSASNPLLSYSTAEQSLTSNLSIGSATVNVGATGAFNVGEPCLLRDSTGAQADVYIQSIGSGTQLTLTQTVPYAWTTANSATIRSFYYGSIYPRSLVTIGGSLVLFLTSYQQFGSGVLTERGGAADLASLSSGYSFDYARGILWPLGKFWDTASAENPCVIAE